MTAMLDTMANSRSTAAQRIGDAGEQMAAERLKADGWSILARQLRLGRDEIDLIAVDPGPPAALVLVEVRRRGRRDFGFAEETLNHRKRVAMRRAAAVVAGLDRLPDGTPVPHLPLRIDLVAIDPDAVGLLSFRHHRGIRP